MNNNERLYNVTMANRQVVGNKSYASVPIELLFADPAFQRVGSASQRKINQLAKDFDPNMMDSIRVVAHDENKMFSIIDGYHRYMACKILNKSEINCEILTDVPMDAEARLKREAALFVRQNDAVEHLRPQQKHRANCILNVKENIALRDLMIKYHIEEKGDAQHGCVKPGQMGGFAVALKMAKSDASILDIVFKCIDDAKWNLNRKGYDGKLMQAIFNIIKAHDKNEDVINAIVQYMKPIDPKNFEADARANYPKRSFCEALCLVLEDYVVSNTNVERAFFGRSIA